MNGAAVERPALRAVGFPPFRFLAPNLLYLRHGPSSVPPLEEVGQRPVGPRLLLTRLAYALHGT